MFPGREGPWAGLHPIAVLVYALTAGCMGMLFTNPVYLLAILVMIVLAAIQAGAGLQLKRYLVVMIPVSIVIVLLNGILCSKGATVILRLPLSGGRAVTLEALLYGLTMAIKLVIVLSVFCLYNAAQDMDAAFSFFSRFAYNSLFTVIISVLMVPRMKRDLVRIGAAMRRRGVSLRSGGIMTRMRAAYPLVKVLLFSSLEGSWESAESMHCRAFGSGRRSFYRRPRVRRGDRIVVAASLLSLSGFAAAAAGGRGFTVFYPTIGRLFGVLDTVFLVWILSGFIVVSLWASMERRWKCIRSKT